jgi:hypothetical protein
MRAHGAREQPAGHHAGRPRRGRRAPVLLALAVLSVVVTAMLIGVGGSGSERSDRSPDDQAAPTGPAPEPRAPYRAFEDGSWWNTPVPDDAPLDPAGEQILDYLHTGPDSGRGCLRLAGAGRSRWGHPIYFAKPSDPSYDVTGVEGGPPELEDLRIPRGAESAPNRDASMSVYDRQKGYVMALTDAEYDADSDSWTATGATVTYLDSNGLHVDTGRSDDRRNRGTHRGNNGATMAVSWDQARAGAIRHVLKIAIGPDASSRFVFPMVGSDGDYDGSDPAVPPQGLRLRVKPSVELARLDLSPEARVIARTLQRYGVYIGDSGGTTSLKLENTNAEGRGRLWDVSATALCSLPFTAAYWDVLEEGYDPSS